MRGGAVATLCALSACLVGVVQSSSASAQSSPTDPSSAVGGPTRAGTPIVNIASLGYDMAGQTLSIRSNPTTLIVGERLDLKLSRQGQGAVTVRTDPTPVAFQLTNNDNGDEAFTVTASVSGTATLRTIVIDVDGNGLYDPARDTVLADGVTPVLSPGQTITLLAILTAPDGGAAPDGSLTIVARAVTGSGATGTAYDGKGDGGGDAVVGPTGATATIVIPTRTTIAGPSLVKSQSVLAGDGTANAVRDAVVTYTLEARFVSALPDARIDDPIPAGTSYVAGSLTLDGAALTDGADTDPGQFAGSSGAGSSGGGAIAVTLANVAAGSVHTIQFKTKIQ